jgi:hypothetical protein
LPCLAFVSCTYHHISFNIMSYHISYRYHSFGIIDISLLSQIITIAFSCNMKKNPIPSWGRWTGELDWREFQVYTFTFIRTTRSHTSGAKLTTCGASVSSGGGLDTSTGCPLARPIGGSPSMSTGALPLEFIFGSRRSSLKGCFSALCLHVSPFGASFQGFVLSSLLGFVRVVCILKADLTPPFRKPRPGPDESWPLCASLSGSLAASIALGSARLDFEATPVVDADHGESESRSRRRRGRCCGLWEQHMGNGVAPEGICAACRARSIRRSQLVS